MLSFAYATWESPPSLAFTMEKRQKKNYKKEPIVTLFPTHIHFTISSHLIDLFLLCDLFIRGRRGNLNHQDSNRKCYMHKNATRNSSDDETTHGIFIILNFMRNLFVHKNIKPWIMPSYNHESIENHRQPHRIVFVIGW